MQDLQYALRTLRKQPLFALVAVLTLALGIGANTAIFTLVYQTLLQPLPVANADRLAFVWNRYGAMNLAQASVSIPDYLDRKTLAAAVEDATLFTNRMAILNEGGSPEQIRSLAVTPSFFSTLGVQPVRGRAFTSRTPRPTRTGSPSCRTASGPRTSPRTRRSSAATSASTACLTASSG